MHMITTAIAGVLVALMVAPGARAGSSTYELNPFTQVAQASAPYSQAVPAPTDTLVGLLGLTKGQNSPPARVAQSYPTGAMAPQQASVGLNPPLAKDPSFITVSGGWYDFNDNDQAADLTAEWRSGTMFWIFKPFAGAMVTSDAGVYGFGGILTDFYFGRRIVVTPSVAIGLYEDGDGKDLGSIFEIRSGLEVGWRFDNRARLSAAIYHISNAGIGSSNPGTEIFSIGYSFPFR